MKILILGANGSIGQSIVLRLREAAGYYVVTADTKNSDWNFDCRVLESVKSIVNASCPDVLVNCVGVNRTTPIGIDSAAWMDVVSVNLLGWYNALAALKDLQDQDNANDRIAIAIGSNSAFVDRTNSSAYCSSKAAMLSLTRCAAREFGKAGVRIFPVQVDPGFVYPSKMSQYVLSDRNLSLKDVVYRSPYGSPVNPSSVANIVEFLCREGKVFAGQSVRFDYAEA
jgi:NAD(P)-dependent dehydrogenase (short-subunit alcohol dehydrogenase family)